MSNAPSRGSYASVVQGTNRRNFPRTWRSPRGSSLPPHINPRHLRPLMPPDTTSIFDCNHNIRRMPRNPNHDNGPPWGYDSDYENFPPRSRRRRRNHGSSSSEWYGDGLRPMLTSCDFVLWYYNMPIRRKRAMIYISENINIICFCLILVTLFHDTYIPNNCFSTGQPV